MGGVLLIGYEMYRMFYTTREGKAKRSISKKKKSTGLIDLEEEEMVDKRDKEQIERMSHFLTSVLSSLSKDLYRLLHLIN